MRVQIALIFSLGWTFLPLVCQGCEAQQNLHNSAAKPQRIRHPPATGLLLGGNLWTTNASTQANTLIDLAQSLGLHWR